MHSKNSRFVNKVKHMVSSLMEAWPHVGLIFSENV